MLKINSVSVGGTDVKGVTTKKLECRQHMPLTVLEQVSVNKKGGGVGTRKLAGPGEGCLLQCCSEAIAATARPRMVARTKWWLKTERKRCVRNIWNRTSTSVGA